METVSGCREFGGEDLRTFIIIQNMTQENNSSRTSKDNG
jgi:hypothetical protein